MQTLEGTLERITYQSEEDGYTVARLTPTGRSYLVTIVGKLAGVRPGETLLLEGEWQAHRDHGRQFAVVTCRTLMPATIDGIRRYLGSGLIKGIGPATARRITETFGRYTLEVLDREPERLAEVPGLGRKKAELIKMAWREQQRIKEVMLFLQEIGLPTGMAVRIYKQYGDEAIQVVRNEPYRLADEVYGIGFLTADTIAASLGVAHDDPRRIAAGLRHTLSTATDDGHTFLAADDLIRRATAMLGAEQILVHEVLTTPALARDLEVVDPAEPTTPVYLKPLAMAETGVAAALLRQQRAPSRMAAFYRQARWDNVFAHLAERHDVVLTPRQQEAVQMALTTKVSILTGGPGTGKTTTLRTVVRLAQARGYRVLLASPTGRAARRLSETTGAEAKTIHRLLEYAPGGGGPFRRCADWPLECDLLVVDEVSMLDILLTNHLLKALPAHAHLLLVGDADQLPSVGPGRVLRDLLASQAVASVHLDTIFRQAAGSGIAFNAQRINHGEIPQLKGLDDFFFFAVPSPEACATRVVELVTERIPARFGLDPRRDIQVLAPTHKGAAGVTELNRRLQAALNPPAPDRPEKSFGATIFRLGDRVIQQRNNYELDVYNGDIGTIVAFDQAEQLIRVQFEDGRVVAYDGSLLDELALAYALSVHKSQGGEYPVVVLPFLMQHRSMLQRNLLYTGVTRARQLAIIVGDQRAIITAVTDERTQERNSGLRDRLIALP
ncbi:ATP-dependent RecD-like DNA helicase [Candidatus Chloroploca sp. M-50]|uniref:ATP-dependent RecD2 DNA helicase n=1 Tax=Candidatus Chloroploca mongolica TaxID=2528176 RepID=A0ABS4DDU4_9CHLR|nr:ATP-dependent RecD-like DNA helicase [Candidatus Chloroploca mongolica]MBP1467504.1 ATP-dependent RecD-like DNA helicase [Candidatus Chloroploca mongolica]